MIEFPKNWNIIGRPIVLGDIEERMICVLKQLDCKNLSLSGGVDSSLLLYFMVQAFGTDVCCYTAAGSEEHPDYIHANLVARHFGVDCIAYIIPYSFSFPKTGDEIVKAFYKHLISKLEVDRIVVGDGIDEFMGGYYHHANNPTEEMYYYYLRRLQKDQFQPLNETSGSVKVLLPYMDEELLSMFIQIPLSERFDSGNRKKIVYQMAEGRLPSSIIERRKYGFCDAMRIKK